MNVIDDAASPLARNRDGFNSSIRVRFRSVDGDDGAGGHKAKETASNFHACGDAEREGLCPFGAEFSVALENVRNLNPTAVKRGRESKSIDCEIIVLGTGR